MPRAHEFSIRVRYSESDQMGVVHHANYLIYMEEGRTALMREFGFPYEDVERRGFGMAVRKVDVRYRAAARYGDMLLVRTWVEGFRGASITYSYEMLKEPERAVVATGSAEVACIGLRDGFRPVPIPADIERALERALAQD